MRLPDETIKQAMEHAAHQVVRSMPQGTSATIETDGHGVHLVLDRRAVLREFGTETIEPQPFIDKLIGNMSGGV